MGRFCTYVVSNSALTVEVRNAAAECVADVSIVL